MVSCKYMKTTLDLPDDLFVAAKKRAAEERTTLRAIIERGLRSQLGPKRAPPKRAALRWVTVEGGLPSGMDVTDRAAMHDWLRRER
jgi:hypothetical protein